MKVSHHPQANIELHVHPFLGKNTLSDVVEAMRAKRLDVVALESLDASLYPQVVEAAEKENLLLSKDDAGIKLYGGGYILNAREYNTKERLHILTIGYALDEVDQETEIRRIIDKGLIAGALVLMDPPYVDNCRTKTAGHISSELEAELEKICKEYSGQIALEWNGYCIPWIRGGLKPILNLLGHETNYYNVNQQAEKLSEKLKIEGYNVPLIADTDLHARSRNHLSLMGTARIIADIEGECAGEILASLRKNIFAGNYQNVKRYVPSSHLLGAFCIPILFPKNFKNPRA